MGVSRSPKVLFVCLGNICRSPLAEGILRRDAEQAGIDVIVDSAGTGDYHIGDLPDPRARQVGIAIGCRMDMRARQVRPSDFRDFDLIVAMDRMNLRDLLRWEGADRSRIHLARSLAEAGALLDVPDPYYGDIGDFEEVARLLEPVSASILERVRNLNRRA